MDRCEECLGQLVLCDRCAANGLCVFCEICRECGQEMVWDGDEEKEVASGEAR